MPDTRVLQGHAAGFGADVLAWARAAGFAQLVFLGALDAALRPDPLLLHAGAGLLWLQPAEPEPESSATSGSAPASDSEWRARARRGMLARVLGCEAGVDAGAVVRVRAALVWCNEGDNSLDAQRLLAGVCAELRVPGPAGGAWRPPPSWRLIRDNTPLAHVTAIFA